MNMIWYYIKLWLLIVWGIAGIVVALALLAALIRKMTKHDSTERKRR